MNAMHEDWTAFTTALTDDLDALIRLYDREVDAATLSVFQTLDFPLNLALLPEPGESRTLFTTLHQVVQGLDSRASTLDALAADYAGLWLNGGVSPYESVWLDEDHLTCQQPMFELRTLYAQSGLQVADWRQRYDDHLVLQLQFVRHLLAQPALDAAALATLIDEHLGYWLPDFVAQVCQRADTDFYAGLSRITQVWLEMLRLWLAEEQGQPLADRAVLAQRIQQKLAKPVAPAMPLKYMPGAGGPSW